MLGIGNTAEAMSLQGATAAPAAALAPRTRRTAHGRSAKVG
jgi:hypothetical protein